MTDKDTGGPAFPTENSRQVGHDAFLYEGMTLRDYFAAKILQGLLTGYVVQEFSIEPAKDAARAYEIADAMMEARK